jgi:hypothetical protein
MSLRCPLRREKPSGIERVYPAHEWRLRRDVAVKVLTPEAAVKPEMRLRFEREARAMAGRDNLWT